MEESPAFAVPSVGPWQLASVIGIRQETPSVKTFSMGLEQPIIHLAGQHVLVRLTAPDGYAAQRSYSIASPPGDGSSIDLTVERLPDGEVSGFLHDEVRIGDTIEIRGPIGGWFVWDGSSPALLLGGGSGIVPLMAMMRLARRQPQPPDVHLIASVRDRASLIYADELVAPDVTVVYTSDAPPGAERPPGRLNARDLSDHAHVEHPGDDVKVFICGSGGFASSAVTLATEVGFDPAAIRIERFGPTN